MNRISVGGFTRITKKAAARAFDSGKTVYLCPVNLNPCTPWGAAVSIEKEPSVSEDFTVKTNAFEHYNCMNSETGRYAAFYVREGGDNE